MNNYDNTSNTPLAPRDGIAGIAARDAASAARATEMLKASVAPKSMPVQSPVGNDPSKGFTGPRG